MPLLPCRALAPTEEPPEQLGPAPVGWLCQTFSPSGQVPTPVSALPRYSVTRCDLELLGLKDIACQLLV